jgi:hypothetical protein
MKCKVINVGKINLEQSVNEWLESGKYEITNLVQTQSADNGYITLTIFYLDLKELREKKLQKLNNINK